MKIMVDNVYISTIHLTLLRNEFYRPVPSLPHTMRLTNTNNIQNQRSSIQYGIIVVFIIKRLNLINRTLSLRPHSI